MATRPQLRGLLGTALKRDFTVAVGLAVVSVCAYKFLVQLPRRRRYEEFYKNFDAQKEFERIRDVGAFQCVNPGGEVNDGW